MCFLTKKVKTQQQNKKIKHKNPCQSQGLNPGPLAPKANALPLHYREYRLSHLTVSTQLVEM